MTWQLSSQADVEKASGYSPLAISEEAFYDPVYLVGDEGWVIGSTRDAPGSEHRIGGGVIVTQSDAHGALEALLARSEELGWSVGWVSAEADQSLDLPEPWHRVEDWVFMSTHKLADVPEASWEFEELDDDADADEIKEFILAHNPRSEGYPGEGLNRLWLGARDANGKLIAAGAVRDFDMGHLAGLVVDTDYRGQGLGRDLLAVLTRRMIGEDGIATLAAFAGNEHALDLYEGVGYRIDHTVEAWEREIG